MRFTNKIRMPGGSLEYHRSRTTEEIVESLRPGADELPKVKPDGRIFDRVKWINELLHRLTSCINPQGWSADDEAMLICGIIENSFSHGFDEWIGRAVAVATGSTIGAKKPVKAE